MSTYQLARRALRAVPKRCSNRKSAAREIIRSVTEMRSPMRCSCPATTQPPVSRPGFFVSPFSHNEQTPPTMNKHQKRPAIEVMAEVQAAAPNLVPHMFMDGAWIWYCGPSLKEDEAARRALSTIGFRFAKRGHVMPDKQTRGYWGHSCDRPTRTHRHRQGGPTNNKPEPEPETAPAFDAAALLAAL